MHFPTPGAHKLTLCYIRLVLGNLAAWTHGACIVYPSETFDPPSIVDAVTQEHCTALHGVPTHFLGVLAEVQRRREEGQTVEVRNLRWVDRITVYTVWPDGLYDPLKDGHSSWISNTYRAYEAAHREAELNGADRGLWHEYVYEFSRAVQALICFHVSVP